MRIIAGTAPGAECLVSLSAGHEGVLAGLVANARRLVAVQDFFDDHADVEIRTLPCGVTFDDGYAVATRVLESSATAVLAFNDLVATGLMGAFSDRGVSVPADISIVGFDDIPFARYLSPPLTTASVPTSELGRHAWQRMWDLLNHRPPRHAIIFRPRIEISGSAGPVRSQ